MRAWLATTFAVLVCGPGRVQTGVVDWITGEFDVIWTGAAPLGVQTEISGRREGDLADVRLLDSGVLVLRVKDDGRMVYCAPHTWVTVTTPAVRSKRQTSPQRIR